MNHRVESEQILNEYKNFLRIVSHDLNAPIRQLDAFIPMLLEDLGDNASHNAKECAGFIQKSLHQLKDKQNALLTLSRIITNNEERQKVDSTHLISSALQNLNAKIDKYTPTLQYKNLPEVIVAPKELITVFQNIIENAIIYQKPNTQIKISVKAKIIKNEIIFAIKDNGIGIDSSQHESIFDIFRRLHGENEYGGGTGMGLTISKAIIGKHYGRMWVESNKSNGITTSFTLPVPHSSYGS